MTRTQQLKAAATTVTLPLVGVLAVVGGYLFQRIEAHEREYAQVCTTIALLNADVRALEQARAESDQARIIAQEVLSLLDAQENTP